jgi:DNA-binding transcriptional ArsR family regulator
MDQEILFTATKWDILRLLAHESKSPIQLAKLANTSIANVSQQLRLLDMAGLVKSVRVPNRDKGQPRLIYSLTKDVALVIMAGRGFAEKRQIDIDPVINASLRILLLPETEYHYPLTRAFWTLEPDLDKIHALLFDAGTGTLHIQSDDPSLKKKHVSFAGRKKEAEKAIRPVYFSKGDGQFAGKGVAVIYDPLHQFSHIQKKTTEVVEK